MGGQLISGSEITRRLNRFQPFLCVGCDHRARRAQQVGISLMMGAPDSAAELVKLRQAKLICALDDNGIGVGYINAGFDDGRANENMVMLVLEI